VGHQFVAEHGQGHIEMIEPRIHPDGSLTHITPVSPIHQLDSCWLVTNERFAYDFDAAGSPAGIEVM
jgi:hypothetical protein